MMRNNSSGRAIFGLLSVFSAFFTTPLIAQTNQISNANTQAQNINNPNSFTLKDAEILLLIDSSERRQCEAAELHHQRLIDLSENRVAVLGDVNRKIAECFESVGNFSKALAIYDSVLENGKKKFQNQITTLQLLVPRTPTKIISVVPNTSVITSTAGGVRTVEMKVNEKTISAVIDTGADVNAISMSKAIQLGIEVFSGNESIAGLARSNLRTNFGVAKSLNIAGTELSNVNFYILDDSALTFPLPENRGGSLKLDMIIGYPVLNLLGAVEFKEGSFSVLAEDKLPLDNWVDMRIRRYSTFIEAKIQGKSTSLVLDTGAHKSRLNRRFAQQNADIMATAQITRHRSYALGGASNHVAKKLTRPEVSIGTGKVILNELEIDNTSRLLTREGHGVLGLDIIDLYGGVIIDYKNLRARFGPTVLAK